MRTPKLLSGIKRKIRVHFPLRLIALCIAAILLTLLLITRTTISNVSAVEAAGVGVYWDSDCQNHVSEIDWGTLYPRMTKKLTVYMRNEENEIAVLWLGTDKWYPPNASEYMTLSWTYMGQTLEPQEVQKLEFILAVSPEIEGITNFYFEIMVQAIHAQITLTDLHTIHLYVNETFLQGENLKIKFYSYSGAYRGEIIVWSGTTPAYVLLSENISHPLNWPIENVTLMLTDNAGNMIQRIMNFVVHRSDLEQRFAELDAAWTYTSPSGRQAIMMEYIAIDGQWPFAPP